MLSPKTVAVAPMGPKMDGRTVRLTSELAPDARFPISSVAILLALTEAWAELDTNEIPGGRATSTLARLTALGPKLETWKL